MIGIHQLKPNMLPPRVAGKAWLYLLVAGEYGPVTKIGVSIDLFERMKTTRRKWAHRSYPIFFRCAFELPHENNNSETERIEFRCHGLLNSWAVVGSQDWFLLEGHVVEQFVKGVIVRRGHPIVRFPKAEPA